MLVAESIHSQENLFFVDSFSPVFLSFQRLMKGKGLQIAALRSS
jgi:hypothetical protein